MYSRFNVGAVMRVQRRHISNLTVVTLCRIFAETSGIIRQIFCFVSRWFRLLRITPSSAYFFWNKPLAMWVTDCLNIRQWVASKKLSSLYMQLTFIILFHCFARNLSVNHATGTLHHQYFLQMREGTDVSYALHCLSLRLEVALERIRKYGAPIRRFVPEKKF